VIETACRRNASRTRATSISSGSPFHAERVGQQIPDQKLESWFQDGGRFLYFEGFSVT
jgi:hypothetical protein